MQVISSFSEQGLEKWTFQIHKARLLDTKEYRKHDNLVTSAFLVIIERTEFDVC